MCGANVKLVQRDESVKCQSCSSTLSPMSRLRASPKGLTCKSCLERLLYPDVHVLRMKFWQREHVDAEWGELERLEYHPLKGDAVTIQVEMKFAGEDGGGSNLFYLSSVPLGQGDNYGPEQKFPERLSPKEGCTFEMFDTGESVELSSLIEQYSGWYCNVTASWDADGTSAL